MTGNIHSTLSFGTVDGPGIRYVVFLQGCPLRCLYCHNPDTWQLNIGETKTIDVLVEDVLKYKRYFKDDGGVTITGGEPLVQIDFVTELCKRLKKENINVCIDTSGITFNTSSLAKFDELIKYVDLFLLDIKHIDEQEAIKLTGKSNVNTLNFAHYLSDNSVSLWIRYILVPGYTSDMTSIKDLKKFINELKNVKKVEVLPYHKLGVSKYKELGIDYALQMVEEPDEQMVKEVKNILTNIGDPYV